MDSTLGARDAFMPHQPRGMGAGLVLALLAHLLLVVALSFSVNWRASEPAGVEAELWAALPQAAAPRAKEPEPRSEPRPPPPPAPVKATPPPPAPPAPRVPDAQIAIEKARKAEATERAEQAEQVERARREAARKDQLRKDEARKTEQREQVRREAAEREKLQAKQRDLEEAANKKKDAAEAQRQAKALEAQREANLKRIAGMAGASGDDRATGAAAQAAGPSAGYAGRIRARIKPNIVFAETLSGNPVASVEVRVAPDGNIVSRRIVKSSGVPAWDEAVLRAIDRTEVLPRDTDGRVPPSFAIEFRPRD